MRKILAELEKVRSREGTVKNITDFGALSIWWCRWPSAYYRHVLGRVNHPSEIVAIGDKLKSKCLILTKTRKESPLALNNSVSILGKGSRRIS